MKKVNDKLLRQMKKIYEEGSGTDRIAREFNLSKTYTRNCLLKSGVKFRNPSKNRVSLSRHNRFIKLYSKGKSTEQIARKYNISSSTVRRHLIKENVKLKGRGDPIVINNPHYKRLTLEKAYMLGVIGPGDGFMEYRLGNGQYRIALEAKDLDFVRYFRFCLERVYGKKPKIKKLGPRKENTSTTFRIRLGSKEVCEDLLRYRVPFNEKCWRVPRVIKNSSKGIKAKYIQGFADSQGCVANYKNSRGIILCNQNKKGLKEICSLFGKFGILDYKINRLGIIISARRSIEAFAENINFIIKRKKKNLQKLLNKYVFYKTPEKEIIKLIPKIIGLRKKKLSYPKISKELNIPQSTVWRHARYINIEA